MENKYLDEFLESMDGGSGLHFQIKSETISKVLSQFEIEDLPDPELDYPGFGWEDNWYVVEDEQIVNAPTDMESLKRWICAFFEMYGGYPLADILDPIGAPTLTDETREAIATSIERNIDDIMTDMVFCKIVSVNASHQYGWEGKTVIYKGGKLTIKKATRKDASDFLEEFGYEDCE